MNIVIYLPWPPSVNSYYMTVGRTRGLKRISKAGREFRMLAETAIYEQGILEPLTDKLNVEVILYPPDNRRRDLDNYMKALLDACTVGGLWEDDSQIDQLAIYRGVTVMKGGVRLEVNEAGPVMPVRMPSD
jgi:crossover junction endodeoxyribonuclease RusA